MSDLDKHHFEHNEKAPDSASEIHYENAHAAAERGHAATDTHGHSLVQFDPVAEAKLVRKIDWHVIPSVSLLYLFCFIDRANIGNAKIAGLEKALGLVGYQYNILITVFYISYVTLEIPANLLCKYMGPGRFLPMIAVLFGLFSFLTAFTTNFSNCAAVRFLLGVAEAGMLPGVAYYLSRWYRKSEFAFRFALFIVTAPLAGAFGGLLAYGILQIDGIGKIHSWQQLFFVEGIITMGLGVITYFTITDRPATARWLTEEEKDMVIARVKTENVGTTVVLDKMDTTKVLRGIISPNTLTTSFMFMLNNVTVQGLAFFLPTIIATIYPTSTTVHKQLMTVPPYLVGAVLVLAVNYTATRIRKMLLWFFILAPLMSTGYIMFLATDKAMVRYGATFLIGAGAFSFGALCNAQSAANTVSDTARASAIGTTVMGGNIGGLIATWSFLPFDAPNYHIGNGLNLATSATMGLTAVGLFFYLKWDNKRREKIDVDAVLDGMTTKEIEDLDWKHPAFRWRY